MVAVRLEQDRELISFAWSQVPQINVQLSNLLYSSASQQKSITATVLIHHAISYDECLLQKQSFHSAKTKLLKSSNTQLFFKVL
jgi:hypothetical protein